MTTKEYATLWVCHDCRFAAEGMSDDILGHDPRTEEPEPLSLLGNYGAGNLTAGLTADEHDDSCEEFVNGEWQGIGECECDRHDFSWSWCHGCGSTLGGERHAYTLWTD